MIDLRKHSSRHLETKLVLPIPETLKYERELHYYFFSPPQLYVNKSTYSEQRMLHKFQSHGRYSSPELTLEELLDEDNMISPLTLLKRYTDNLEKDITSVPERTVIHELQTVANAVRHENKAALQDCKDMARLGMKDDLKSTLEDWYRNTLAIQESIRSMLEVIRGKCSLENRLLVAYLWADEAVSLLNEKQAIDLYMACSPLGDDLAEILTLLLSFSRDEAEYRNHQNYVSGGDNPELIQYRRAALKKWTQSALYLVPEVSRWPKRVSEILAGTAAAVAMVVATVISIFAEKTLIRNSMQWVLVIIIGYVFKDRIKEWLRVLFRAVLPKMMADEISSFRSPKSNSKICSSRIRLHYEKVQDLPARVRDIRTDKTNPFKDMLPEENVIHYVRNLVMHPLTKHKIEREKFPRENNFTLVTRIRLDDFLKEMDDPKDIVFRMDPNADELDQLNSERVYHLHLVLREKAVKEDLDIYSHYTIVLNKAGIVRIEQMNDT